LTVTFSLDGQDFMALNGGPEFKFNQGISLMAHCKTQKELDTVWKKLTAGGGKELQCGWLKDKYGLSWQIVPNDIEKMIEDKRPKKIRPGLAGGLEHGQVGYRRFKASLQRLFKP